MEQQKEEGCEGALSGSRAEVKGMAEHTVPGSASPGSIQGKPQDPSGQSQHVGLSVQGRWEHRQSRAVPVPAGRAGPGHREHAAELSRHSQLGFNSFQRRVHPKDTVTLWPAGRACGWGVSLCLAAAGTCREGAGWAQTPRAG